MFVLLQPNPTNLISQLPDDEEEEASSTDIESDSDKPTKSGKNKRNKSKDSSGKSSKGDGVYVPPKLSAVHYDGEDTKAERMRKQLERAKKRALRYFRLTVLG